MDRRGENLKSIYMLLLLMLVFFWFEQQDPQKMTRLFSFDREAVASGEVWRVVTYQFALAGQGWLHFPRVAVLFFTLMLLWIMGAPVEEEWGTRRFLTLFLISSLTSSGIAAIVGVPLLGSYFVNFSLLFVYASMFPQRIFRLLAVGVAMLLVAVVIAGGASNLAALGGAIASYLYYLLLRPAPMVTIPETDEPEEDAQKHIDAMAMRNAARFVAIKQAVASESKSESERLIAQFDRETVKDVNICPPADFKPDHNDGYCIRCEGFAECSARFLRASLEKRAAAAAPAPASPPVSSLP